MARDRQREDHDASPDGVRVEATVDLAGIGGEWRAFERVAVGTPYQSFGFAEAWCETIGRVEGVQPAIVTVRDGRGELLALLPLGLRSVRGARIAGFLGGKHSNAGMALHAAGRWTLDLHGGPHGFFTRAAAAMGGVDLFALLNQPLAWGGFANPLAAAPRAQPSPSASYGGRLEADFAALHARVASSDARKKLRRKERMLEALGPVQVIEAADAAQALRVLDAFRAQKGARLKARGIESPFEATGASEFLARLALAEPGDVRAPLRLFALTAGTRIVATMGVVPGQRCASGMFMSFEASPEVMKHSPGDLLLGKVVERLCGEGFSAFDLGVGEAAYKQTFCPDAIPLVDGFHAASPLGRLAAAPIAAGYALKRIVKTNPTLRTFADRMRRGLGAGKAGREPRAA